MITATCTITYLDASKVERQHNMEIKNDEIKQILDTEDVHTVIQTKADLVFQKLWSEWLKIEKVGDLNSVSFSIHYAEA